MAAVGRKPIGNASPQSKIPISLRVRAWWDGNELQIRQKTAEEEAGEDDSSTAPTRVLDRATMLQELWGEGLCDPGNIEFLLQLVKPLGLDPAMTVVNLGAGLGGGARIMVEHFGPWVQGLESDKELAEAGMTLSETAGMGKKAQITYFKPDQHAYRPGIADCVLAKEFFWKVEDKDRMLQSVNKLLKDRGQFLFTDYVLCEGTKQKDLNDWAEEEPGLFPFWTQAQYEACLEAQKFDVRINEDITTEFAKLVTDSWGAFLRNSRMDDLSPETGQALIREAEFWTRRIKAMDEGQVQIRRIYAIKKFAAAGGMSDW